jgi:intracellular septation protein
MRAKEKLSPGLKFMLEMGPLLAFFAVNFFGSKFGLNDNERFMYATGVFMVAIIVALVAHYALTKTLATMPLITAVPVLLFGGLTLYFNDESFIKMKPTFMNVLIGITLLIGLYFKKNLLEYLFQGAFKLSQQGWRTLTFNYALFSFLLAALNEVVWRTQTTDFWVSFKVWGIMPLTFLFMLSQMRLIQNNTKKD